ncbi:uncharacterized protein METZ01_LOCUS188051 [marine metagenome]|uniref:Uncharacterized protein n=1 Tax=marine metagenome TaxID=408172 RepID=A0A382DC16_9ZZZZ
MSYRYYYAHQLGHRGCFTGQSLAYNLQVLLPTSPTAQADLGLAPRAYSYVKDIKWAEGCPGKDTRRS